MPSQRPYPITTATGIGIGAASSSSSLPARSSSITGFAANKSMAHLNAHGQKGGLSPGFCLTYDAGACVFRQLHYRLLIHWISVDNGNKALPPACCLLPPPAPAKATSVAAHKFVHKLTQSEREGGGRREAGRGREVERERNRQGGREGERQETPWESAVKLFYLAFGTRTSAWP